MPQTFATADIGSNTVHLLIAQTDGRAVVRLDNQSYWLALGEEVAETGSISKQKARDLIGALTSFKKLAASRKAATMHVFATEAMRRAANHKEVLTSIRQKTGTSVQIITPEREAELAIRGAMIDSYGEMPTVFFDVGGGSAQIVRLEQSGMTHFHSLPLGTGTLRSSAKLDDPVTTEALQRLHAIADAALDPIRDYPSARRLVGGGGVARGILRALHRDRDRNVLRFEVDYLEKSLCSLSSTVASRRFGISSTRSRTLLPGVIVISKLMSILGTERLLVSEFGIREGTILEMAAGDLKAAKV